MNKRPSSKRRSSIFILLLVWFFIWGICPWDNASAVAQPLNAAQARHGRQEMDDTHHASKGITHSCTGPVSIFKQESTWGKSSLKSLPENCSSGSIVFLSHLYQSYLLSLPVSQAPEIPKRFSNLYQFNSSLLL